MRALSQLPEVYHDYLLPLICVGAKAAGYAASKLLATRRKEFYINTMKLSKVTRRQNVYTELNSAPKVDIWSQPLQLWLSLCLSPPLCQGVLLTPTLHPKGYEICSACIRVNQPALYHSPEELAWETKEQWSLCSWCTNLTNHLSSLGKLTGTKVHLCKFNYWRHYFLYYKNEECQNCYAPTREFQSCYINNN